MEGAGAGQEQRAQLRYLRLLLPSGGTPRPAPIQGAQGPLLVPSLSVCATCRDMVLGQGFKASKTPEEERNGYSSVFSVIPEFLEPSSLSVCHWRCFVDSSVSDGSGRPDQSSRGDCSGGKHGFNFHWL